MTDPLSPAPDALLAVNAAIEAMTATVAVALGLAQAGRRLDLAGLDQEIGTICAAALTLPADQGRGVRPALQSLLQAVDALSITLQASRTDPA